MKKLVSLLLAVCMIAACSVAFAMPKNVTYANTVRFLQALEAADINYSYLGIDQDDDEHVRLTFDDEVNINFFFTQDNEECNIRIWNLVELNPDSIGEAYRICNELNYNYKFCAFYVDPSDNTVTMSMDLILRDSDDMGDICFEALVRVLRIYQNGHEALLAAAK